MKHFYRITLAVMVLFLLFSVETTAYAQKFIGVKTNSDGSYSRAVVIETFQSYIDTVKTLPKKGDEEEIQEFLVSFFNKLPYTDDYYEQIIIRTGDENSEEVIGPELNKLTQECISLLEQKQAQVAKQQNEMVLERKKPKLTYPQIALRIVLPIIGVLAIAAIVFFWFKYKKKKKKTHNIDTLSPYSNSTNNNVSNGTGDVIIRRKTTSVLHKQSLDDVVNNSNYMTINCTDFCDDTAVKTMYIKNTCIMDIYNRYADDLRNPNNPKEDGCMVLGRWVHDEKLDEYNVSLEEVVFPGDDAVFSEYELDFGGKIKVKITDKLRKLRRESDLQYDLTCWVHSHPGLGVFFSNTDCSLHLLHKHPTHPQFLTAIVIDILTPQQELGIFTFKHDLSINSKSDVKQLYSLEEWYKWAVESKRSVVFKEEHFNTLENAKSRNNRCYNVQLSNSTVIDLDIIATNQDRDSLYFVHGFTTQQSDQITNIADKIESTDTLTDNELVGCFMVVTHRSYPTIKNAVAKYLDKIRFVLVYSIADGKLTTIPVIFNDLCIDESYYGEQPLEELKIWTRRKR